MNDEMKKEIEDLETYTLFSIQVGVKGTRMYFLPYVNDDFVNDILRQDKEIFEQFKGVMLKSLEEIEKGRLK